MLSIVRLTSYNENNSNIFDHASKFQKSIITHYENSKSTKNTTVTINNNDKITPTLKIKNKYFTALVRLQPFLLPSDHVELNDSSSIEDGIILIFPLMQPSSFDSLQSIHDNATHHNQCGETIRLCIGVYYNSSQSITTEEEYSKRVLWCLDNGYEYIEADISSDGIMKGHEDREKENFARVIEAIEGTIWSSAVKNPPPQSSNTMLNTSQMNKVSTPNQTNATEKIEPVQEPTKNNTNELKVIDTSNEKTSEQDKDEEEMFDNLESILQEAKQIRENSKTGAFTSDEERRNVASNTAMKLMNLLNITDDDSESDDDA